MAYMGYEAADLLPLVRELTERYTSKASTSVPWETAQQLMEAVLYCIGETQETGSGLGQNRELAGGEMMTAREAYDRGYHLVIRRAETARKLYNKWIISFNRYESECYSRTVTRNIPEFFKWYDPRFNPQQDFTGLDYPVPGDLGKRPGIDRVDRYLACIWTEQRFLGSLASDYVKTVLTAWGRSGGNNRSISERLCCERSWFICCWEFRRRRQRWSRTSTKRWPWRWDLFPGSVWRRDCGGCHGALPPGIFREMRRWRLTWTAIFP